MQRSALSIAFAAIALGLGAVPAVAQEQAGLAFRDAQVLKLAPGALKGAADQLMVCNGGGATATKLKAAAGGFGFKGADGRPLDDDAVVGTPAIRHDRLKPGSCMRVQFGVDGTPPTLGTGSFAGEVTVSSAGQGIARRELTITGPADEAVAPRAVVDTVKIKVTHWWGPLHGIFGHDDHDATVPLQAAVAPKRLDIAGACRDGAKTPSTDCPAIGVVAHDAVTGQLSLGGATGDSAGRGGVVELPVHLHGARKVGDYTGTIDPGQTADDRNAIKMEVSVTQAWPWALLALLLGCAAALWPQWWARRTRPAKKVRAHANGLQRRYAAAIADFHGSTDPRHFPEISGPRPDDVEVYAKGVAESLDLYLGSMVFLDTSTKAYKAIEQSLTTADEDIDCLQEPTALLASLGLLGKTLEDLLTWLAAHRFSDGEPEMAREAAKLLARQELEVGSASKLKADADAEVTALRAWRDLAERLLRCQLWWRAMAGKAVLLPENGGMQPGDGPRHLEAGARLAQAKADLLRARDTGELEELGVKKRLAKVYDELGYLGGRYGFDEPLADGAFIELSDYWATTAAPAAMKDMLMMPSEDLAARPVEQLVAGATAVGRRPATPAVVAASRLWIGDAVCIGLALIVAILTAMVAIVNGKNFGTLSDWITVVLIGTTAQGVVSGIIPTVNTALQDRFGSVLSAAGRESTVMEPSAADDGEPAGPPPSEEQKALPTGA